MADWLTSPSAVLINFLLGEPVQVIKQMKGCEGLHKYESISRSASMNSFLQFQLRLSFGLFEPFNWSFLNKASYWLQKKGFLNWLFEIEDSYYMGWNVVSVSANKTEKSRSEIQ